MALVHELVSIFNAPPNKGGPSFASQLIQLIRRFDSLQRSLPWQSDIAETASVDSKIVCQLLEVLYDEKVSDACKIQLLILIEEHLSLFAITKVSGNQLVQSLLNVASHSRSLTSMPGYVGTLLQTIASIIIQFDLLMFKEADETIQSFILLLLKILELKESLLELKYRTIQCLNILEEEYPTLLYSKLRYLYEMVKGNRSFLFEALLLLFLTVMKNGIRSIVNNKNADSKYDELFSQQSETFSSWGMNFEEFSARITTLKEKSCNHEVGKLSEKSNLASILCYCLEQSSQRLTVLGQVQMVHEVCHLLCYLPDESPAVLKTTVYRWATTANIAVLEAILLLKNRFGDKLFGILLSKSDDLLDTIMAHITCSKMTILHRLLVVQMLSIYPVTQKCLEAEPPSQNDIPSSSEPKRIARKHLQTRHMRDLSPSSFDPLDVKYKKVILLSSLYEPSVATGTFLINSINGIRKQVQYLGIGRSSAVLMKLMFLIHGKFHEFDEISQKITSLLLGLTYEHISLTPATLHYLECLETESTSTQSTDRNVAQECLSQLCDYVADHVAAALEQPKVLPYVMAILSKGAALHNAKPKIIMEVLLRVIKETHFCEAGDWYKGHLILDICKEVMKQQDTHLYYEDLREVLTLIQEQYTDLDVTDRAQMFLNMLNSLSSKRIEEVFHSKINIKATVDQLARKGIQSLPSLQSSTLLDYSILSLTKKSFGHTYALPDCLFNSGEIVTESEDELLNHYDQFLIQNEFIIRVIFTACFSQNAIENATNGVLYFPEIRWVPSLKGVVAHNWSSPYLDQELLCSDSLNEINLLLENTEPTPFKITPCLEFTYEDGRAMQSSLLNMEIDISDLCLALPIKFEDSQWKKSFLKKLRKRVLCDSFTVLHFTERSKFQFDCFTEPFTVHSELEDLVLFFPPRFHVFMKVTLIELLLYRIELATDANHSLLSDLEFFLHQEFHIDQQ